MRHPLSRLAATAAGLLALSLLVPASAPAQQDAGQLNAQRVSDLDFRNIGPAVTGGRIHDVEALPDDPSTVYVATASGGLWRSTNAGTTWDALFQHQEVSTFGDIDIAPTDSEIIYAGTGEQQNRQSTSWGNGVYRSDDAGDTWTHLGLEETRHIAEVEVHPEDSDVAWVAAQGNLWSASEERGEFRDEFLLTIPFTPRDRDNLSSFMMARNDGEHYGELWIFEVETTEQVFGPRQIEVQIDRTVFNVKDQITAIGGSAVISKQAPSSVNRP